MLKSAKPFVEGNNNNLNAMLSEMELRKDIIEQAISEGAHSFLNVNKFHPKTTGGSRAWQEITAVLREQLVRLSNNWKSAYNRGLELVINKENNISIVVTSGDKDTGLKDGFPRTKNSKGSVTRGYISQNYDLFDEEPRVSRIMDSVNNLDPNETWILLYYIDRAKREIRFELSLPLGFSGTNENLKISSWINRIVFAPYTLDNRAIKITPKTEFNQAVDFDLTKKPYNV